MSAPLPLAGIRVIDYSHFLAGPHLSRSLAAMGAEVIKVERPGSGDAGRSHAYIRDGRSGYFIQQNMGKRGLCVDMKDTRGAELMRRLIASADVFVENYRPGALTRLGLGYEELSARHPGLIYCSVSAYGHTGPDAAKAGFGLIAEAKSGLLAQLGVPGAPPPLLRVSIADMYAGTHGVAAVCAALYGRTRSGKGTHIDLSLYDCTVSIHDYAVQEYVMSGGAVLPRQTGADMPNSTVYGIFSAHDGHLVIAAQVDDAWVKLARLIGGEALAGDSRFHTATGRNSHRLEILPMVSAWVEAQAGQQAAIAALEAAGIPCAPVQTIDQVLADPQIIARDMIVDLDDPVLGPIKACNLPYRFADADTRPTRSAPLLGQDNAAIAAELGFDAQAIAAMEADGVLYAEKAAPST
ncbi:CoA transferase [Novosphingobium sp. SG707]|uniref:CoA transferase n=1 Tax=Novosphingobium sp. SG707 TaxID=2586996 RepID=UPI0014483344|nr:crotonobetainyl-CoA:carnitine CoA-transferase CaiB-like acyl-CoA transferase [Novosphingobium sp. SG707]